MAGKDGFGQALRRLRLAAGLTQEALADRAGVSPRAVSDLERDPHRTPRLDTVTLLADALGPQARPDLLAAARPGPPRRPTRLFPRAMTPLIGRDSVSAALVDLFDLAESRLLTLTGPGGVGKTRVALEVMDRIADDFPDGAVFVDLAPLRAEQLVMTAVARQFGLDERDAAPLWDRLLAVLRDREVLIVFDNFEHVIGARADVVALLAACPGVGALVTSRVPLRVRGEREYRIAPLELPPPGTDTAPACMLFADRARAAGLDLPPGSAPVVAELCRRLDGLPLAIELAAARVRLLPPEALLRRLDRRLPLLVGGPHDLPDRQRTMRDAIAWSYDLLSERARGLFRRISVFDGGCPTSALESEESFWDTLGELVDASLATVEGNRIRVLETIREYGIECLTAAGEADATIAAHARHYRALAESDAPHRVLEAERDNLRAAVTRSIDRADADTALGLCTALARSWYRRGHVIEGLGQVRAALVLPADDRTRCAALLSAAQLALDVSDVAEAAAWSDEAVGIARRTGHDLAAALNTRGSLARLEDRYADSATDYAEAAAVAEPGGHDHAEALIGLSYAAFFAGDTTRAEDLAQAGLAAIRANGDARDLATALTLLAWQEMHAGHWQRSDDYATEAVELFRDLGETVKIAEGLRQRGTTAAMLGDLDRAEADYRECLVLHQSLGDERVTVQLLAHLSHVALLAGDPRQARDLAAEGLAGSRRFDDRWSVAMAATMLGHAVMAEGDVEAAKAAFAEAAATFLDIGNPLYLAWCLEGLAGVAVAEGDLDLAAGLCAARDASRADIAAHLPPMHPSAYQDTVAAVADLTPPPLPLADLISELAPAALGTRRPDR
ncbi:MAG TPA: helix-turn-helix domain-containing protein [Actinokineospora sp.]|nr:helix-turn-helix domain-containing protein [Actinokineospora sp.]